jgi:hypothetical protein
MKEFNITGTCIPEKHYMVDTSGKIAEILVLIEKGKYFTMNRPRQYGKTTTLYFLEKALTDRYLLISTSFEGLGEEKFKTEENFCSTIFSTLSEGMLHETEEKRDILKSYEIGLKSLESVAKAISQFIKQEKKKVVLFIDEVDKASNHTLFLNFLGMLRNKYLNQNRNNEYTFHSVVLAGVYDIKNLKQKMRPDSESKYNSPWNVAIDFKVDMSFSAEEIGTMLNQWIIDNGQWTMDIPLLSKEIYNYTSGYPFLVSKLCKVIDEDLDKDWSIDGIHKAINITLKSENTLFDDLIKNLEIYSDLYQVVYAILVDGRKFPFEIYNPLIKLGVTFGIFSEREGSTAISNKVFETLIYNYMISKKTMQESNLIYDSIDFIIDNQLNLESVLNKFQEVMHDEYREKDVKFIEREGRLLFLCFLKPIINGNGFYYVEPQTRKDHRMDILITFGKEEYVVELKIWRGPKKEEDAFEQLSGYLDSKRKSKGYLLMFNFNQTKDYKKEWIHYKDKDIYRVEV